jgi:hypothetical protein
MRAMFVWLPPLVLAVLLTGCAKPTPYEAEDSFFFGGAAHKQLGDHRYQVTVDINGSTPASILKPMVVRKAQAIARGSAYAAFELEKVDVHFHMPSNGWGANAVLRFSRQKETAIRGKRYVTAPEGIDSFQPSFQPSDAKGLAKLHAHFSGGIGAGVNWMKPVFLDAIGATKPAAYVRPGQQFIGVFAVYRDNFLLRPFGVFFILQADLAPDTTYNIAGTYERGKLQAWLEEEVTKRRVPGSDVDLKVDCWTCREPVPEVDLR